MINSDKFENTVVDYDKLGKLVSGVGKLVDTLVRNGYDNFDALATYIAENDVAKYERAKPVLRGVWNFIANQKHLAEVSREKADKIYDTIDQKLKTMSDSAQTSNSIEEQIEDDYDSDIRFLEKTLRQIGLLNEKKVLFKVKKALMKLPSIASEYDHKLNNLWEDICEQVQSGEYSYEWSEDGLGGGGYIGCIEGCILDELNELDLNEINALWILTDGYEDCLCNVRREIFNEENADKHSDITNYLLPEVLHLAGSYTNKRIRKCLDADC